MNLRERIARRQRADTEPRLVRDYDALSPVAHPEDPTGRGPILERLLDHLDPAFEGELPGNAYLWGSKGTGKSAVVTALFAHLVELTDRSQSAIPTTTRAERPTVVEFVYVDARTAKSDFALCHAVLDELVDESVPEHGVGTAQLRARLREQLDVRARDVVVAVDHLGEPETHALAAVGDLFDPFSLSISWLGIGRERPADVEDAPETCIEFESYRRHALVDVLTARVSEGLGRHALDHEQVRTVAEWADGDAHDALAAVFGAADHAMCEGNDRITGSNVDDGLADVPRAGVSLGRVLALSANRQRVLLGLVDLDGDRVRSVNAAAEAIAEGVDLSAATVERILYELAEVGITRRVTQETTDGIGRPPSRLEPRFPTDVFRRLHALSETRR